MSDIFKEFKKRVDEAVSFQEKVRNIPSTQQKEKSFQKIASVPLPYSHRKTVEPSEELVDLNRLRQMVENDPNVFTDYEKYAAAKAVAYTLRTGQEPDLNLPSIISVDDADTIRGALNELQVYRDKYGSLEGVNTVSNSGNGNYAFFEENSSIPEEYEFVPEENLDSLERVLNSPTPASMSKTASYQGAGKVFNRETTLTYQGKEEVDRKVEMAENQINDFLSNFIN